MDPSARSKIQDIELVQNSAVCFISNLKGRTDSVSKARNQLQLQSLEERRKNHRLCFLTQILQSEDLHRTLWWDCLGQTAGDSHHSFSCQRRAKFNVHQEKRFSRYFPSTNYSWNAWRKRQITIKQQNAVRIANSDPKIAKTRGFPIDISCCGSSTSTEVNTKKSKFDDGVLFTQARRICKKPGWTSSKWPARLLRAQNL